tara:strand:- start:173 stop:370 length:198 start_codon:yes stop_codon:yes gene_type:complete
MGRVKDWLMTMESLAEEAIDNGFDEEEAVQFMIDNLDSSLPALRGTLRDIYHSVDDRINGPDKLD